MFTTQRRDRRVRRQTRFLLESLDSRLVLSAGAGGAAAEVVVHHPVADHAHLHAHAHHTRPQEVLGHGLPATLPLNVSPGLRLLYREYKEQGSSRNAPGLPGSTPLSIGGARVAVTIKADFPPTLNTEISRLRAVGLRVVRTIPNEGLAVGTLPIAALPAVAGVPVELKPTPPRI